MRIRCRDLKRKSLGEVVYDIVPRAYQFHQNRLTSPYDGRYSLQGNLFIERTLSNLDEIVSKTVRKDKDSDSWSKTK